MGPLQNLLEHCIIIIIFFFFCPLQETKASKYSSFPLLHELIPFDAYNFLKKFTKLRCFFG